MTWLIYTWAGLKHGPVVWGPTYPLACRFPIRTGTVAACDDCAAEAALCIDGSVILKGMTPLLDMSGPPESFPPPVAIVHSEWYGLGLPGLQVVEVKETAHWPSLQQANTYDSNVDGEVKMMDAAALGSTSHALHIASLYLQSTETVEILQ